ncbi:MAG TPA: polysaccharide deacetylase [Chloroflexus aurantiacus]|uniref:Polysaccharide deacetylase n=1 Tax=Chloroflexus aurantiacus (strain ATCC 29366 / DSM 635 / J-10-fl) TaxID=324602 RepID=A9WCG3_CHLAA|nr:polysaccharide deacetylase family protein [Chloroflexus aurantiacus]ABY34954.1 polysaccharide deacetylase [Chloroflexus aurantiacus J-10-fl]HBW68279.1 polysaccharide deacetylase [Chloroflexus aurantiacus]
MISRQFALSAIIVSFIIGAVGVFLFISQRLERCAAPPFVDPNLLPNARFATPGDVVGLPEGWGRGAGGVEVRGPAVDGQGFDLDGDGRALQLIGIANYALTPPIGVQPGTSYCFTVATLTDSLLRSPTRARLVFEWYDDQGVLRERSVTPWQPVVLWTPERPPTAWTTIAGYARAPQTARILRVRIEPSSDDRIYLDMPRLQRGGHTLPPAQNADVSPPLTIAPWPEGYRAAVAFTFDWETAMGGLIHSRSVDDPLADEDPIQRGMRMRTGVETSMSIFARYNVRATYFATGYNFLMGNREQRRFMNDPVFTWASAANGWRSDRWTNRPWFADDPYGTVATDPAWYFGDQIEPLRAAGHEIQSHTFSHLYGGYADAATWRADIEAWNSVAAERGIGIARALAFPWSSSAGMSDANWDVLEQGGIRAVTRLSDYGPYNLFPLDERGLVRDPHCRWLPGREGRIIACPDFYLTPARAKLAVAQIEQTVAAGGMIDIWSHTEEVTSAAQQAAWEDVVSYTVGRGDVWVAPFSEIAGWQIARMTLNITTLTEPTASTDRGRSTAHRYQVQNTSPYHLVGMMIDLPPDTTDVAINNDIVPREQWQHSGWLRIDLAAGQTVEVTLWPTRSSSR